MSTEKTRQVVEILKQHNQNHIIKYMQNLTEQEKELIENQILSIDFSQMSQKRKLK